MNSSSLFILLGLCCRPNAVFTLPTSDEPSSFPNPLSSSSCDKESPVAALTVDNKRDRDPVLAVGELELALGLAIRAGLLLTKDNKYFQASLPNSPHWRTDAKADYAKDYLLRMAHVAIEGMV